MQANGLALEDIILPPAISWWPLAWGWWALIILSIIAVGTATYLLMRWLNKRKQLRLAVQLLEETTANLQDSALYAALNTWLKIQLQDSHPQVLHLHGQAWADCLQASTQTKIFSDSLLHALSQGLYQPSPISVSRAECLQAATLWLSTKKRISTTNGGQHD